ncbi:putative cellulose synthase (UDP-forming) [Helianthus anomalus]
MAMLKAPLSTSKPASLRWFNRLYALVHLIAIFALVYRHCCNLITSPFTTILLLVADLVLAFLWTTWQTFFLNPVHHQVFPQNLPRESEFPGLDVFVCTADPFKEPPIGVVNTVLSVLAYDYPPEKLSVYLSDDGGSQLTLFAFMEAAKFARHWLPYCRKYDIMDRSPEVYFGNDPSLFPETSDIQSKYEDMKTTIQYVMDQGSINIDQIKDARTIKALRKWTAGFTRQQHPTVIEVLLKRDEDKDATGHCMPNLIYLAREKNKAIPHNFKAGALNALIRASTIMTNAPIFLTLDCDMFSNDPKTPCRALCHFMDSNSDLKLAFVQFPQRFHNLNQNDIYAGQHVAEIRNCPLGMDGLSGVFFMGTGGFFRRRALIEYPTKPYGLWNEPDKDGDTMALAHRVTSCSYEDNTKWGSEIGFRYGVLVEDIYTGYHLQCLGWSSVACTPTRAAFLGKVATTLNDALSQSNRWYMGMLQIGFSKFSPMTYGIRFLNPLQAMCYSHFYFRALWSFPVIIYAFLPQLALINSLPIFPKVSDPWFSLYAFLFLGSHAKDFLDHVLAGSVFKKWWNSRRMWLILGCSSYAFSILDWFLTSIGMSTCEFNVTSKVSDNELTKRYEKGIFEFGVESPLLLMVSTTTVVNLFAFLVGVKRVLTNGQKFEDMFVQLFLAGLGVIYSWPVYEGMVLRSDKGKMPSKTTLKSICLALVICFGFSSSF